MIAIGSDHAGFELKQAVMDHLRRQNIELVDLGAFTPDRVDYPDYGVQVARAVVSGRCRYGIVICGTGIGISIAANKVKGIRAALCCSTYMAEMARKHNDANVLAMGGRTTAPELACHIVDTFLATAFEGGRHADRIEKIHSLTNL